MGLPNDKLSFEVSGRLERLTGVAGGAQVIEGVRARAGPASKSAPAGS